jgi:hypothetical protein
MNVNSRRNFLKQVGAGMLVAGVGPALATDLGLTRVFAGEDDERLTFGALEPLVTLMQETPIAQLQAAVVKKYRDGEAGLRDLVAAAALANARTFGGEDYDGFHAMFSLMPALSIAKDLPESRQLLPILKVIYRNSSRIQEFGGRRKEVLHPIRPGVLPEGRGGGEVLQEAVRRNDLKGAEATFAALSRSSSGDAFNQLQTALHDSTEVHRVNLVYRAWSLLEIVGRENAHTMLRQSLHYFVGQDHGKYSEYFSGARNLLPKLMDRHGLVDRPTGKLVPDDAWVEQTSRTLFGSTPEAAAEMAAGALAEGISPDAVHEAIAVASNQLVLRDEDARAHGATVGVHACDTVNALRNIGRASEPRNAFAGAILAAYYTASDGDHSRGNRRRFLQWEPYPRQDAREQVKSSDPEQLLRDLDDAIRQKSQPRAAALVHRYGELDAPAAPVFSLLRTFVISENGSKHGEKFFGTVTEEFGRARACFRWRQLVGMARYAASMFGEPTPGQPEAKRLLGLES